MNPVMTSTPTRFSGNSGLKVALTSLALGAASLGIGYAIQPKGPNVWPNSADKFERVQAAFQDALKYDHSPDYAIREWVDHIRGKMANPVYQTKDIEAFLAAEAKAQGLPDYETQRAMQFSREVFQGKSVKQFSDLQPLLNEFADKYYAKESQLAQQFKTLSAQVVKHLQSDSTREIWGERLTMAGAATIIVTLLLSLTVSIGATHDVEVGWTADGKPVYFFRPKKGN